MKAKTDYTYCYGMNCDKAEECWRYVGKYEFDKDSLYSFVAGKINNKCVEEKDV